ncbi:20S core proteasome subunit alpha 2 [Cyanidioschyzon merolae strain 10D]|jgi:20S proteasome subunit alpha 2|uniref:Proteasome subunit alpha type n=1 Tax=Cyanidioschyzon merolae (strain NIES-3377 / 10D) TaxID=280699 RepID=M1UT19_CYAM1|nr:20S core proteasome subunit alpha 2 [Cyanidioschyzon merolae strain 10D]BAM80856.1 20S core proteasome subunit alpha 2 [Cyanidioschyzon merolae strain 10D]|eukprot:XP_005536892.1 20S core proteasome subunit alpha 2 [Cyanidioschyzon merolae strain 10D]
MADSASSFSLTVFSSSGKLNQLEYALKAVQAGATALGIRAKNGCVIATEKRLPSALADARTIRKVEAITAEIGAVYAGMGPDYRIMVKKARNAAQKYYQVYRESIPVHQLVREVATVMQEFTQSGGVRPFGMSMLIAGHDEEGPQLAQVDPSGSFFFWKATAIGKNMVNAKTFLEKRYQDDVELEDAIHMAILTLKEGFDGKMMEHNIEIGVVGAERRFRALTPAEIRDYLGEVE